MGGPSDALPEANLELSMRIGLGLTMLYALACDGDRMGPPTPAMPPGTAPPVTAEVVPDITAAPPAFVLAADLDWQPLNPARGDQSPQAANVWGDRTEEGATGFLVRFVDGFSSPPHIHNVTYRGVVMHGRVHNDHASAPERWMAAGSYWTQPAGASHITSASGSDNLAYIEIESGPYLVKPTEEAFDNGEAPVNVHASNIVWLNDPGEDEPTTHWAYLWGSPNTGTLSGGLLKLEAGATAELDSQGPELRSVVVSGDVVHGQSSEVLSAGSLFSSAGPSRHGLTCSGTEACLIYLRTRGEWTID